MIDQNLINECEKDIDSFGSLMKCQAIDLLDAYISLIEQNAELHKELARLKSERVLMNNDGKPYAENPPKNLAM